jgi:hypothetical protein
MHMRYQVMIAGSDMADMGAAAKCDLMETQETGAKVKAGNEESPTRSRGSREADPPLPRRSLLLVPPSCPHLFP